MVAKGFTQVEGIIYNDIFLPVVKHCSIRILLGLVNQYDLELEQLDVKTTFLHGNLKETIYMNQPKGFEEGENKVCLLKKSLYGLKQSPRMWYLKFDEFLIRYGFIRNRYDNYVYILKNEKVCVLYLLLYVDDILIASANKEEIRKLKESLNTEFEMKDLGSTRRILWIDIQRDRAKGELFLSQSNYLKKVVERFRMHQSKPVSTPLGHHTKLFVIQALETIEERSKMNQTPYVSGVGSIMYGMVCSRPDLAHAISIIRRFMGDLGSAHWEAVKWTLRYLNGSLNAGLRYKKTTHEAAITGYVDADFVGNVGTRKSLTGYVFTLFGTTISWKENQQSVVALSTTEAEYMALAEGVKEAIWLKGMVNELGIAQACITIHCDSQSVIHLANHQMYHESTKHIDVKLHFIRDVIESEKVKVEKVLTEENPADMFIKSLSSVKFKHCLDLINFEGV